MKRRVTAFMLAAAVSGCMSTSQNTAETTEPVTVRASGSDYIPYKVPGLTGPWGEPIPLAAPYTSTPPRSASHAKNMMSQSVPLNWVQTGGPGVIQAGAQMPGMGMPQGGMPMMPPAGMIAPPGVPFKPPLMPPGGMMPGGMQMPGGMPMPGGMQMPGMSGGPKAGIMPASYVPPGAVAAVGAITGPGGGSGNNAVGRTQVRFTGPDGMKVAWLTQGFDGKPTYSGAVVEAPGRYNFMQASIYRLKLSAIRGRPGLEVYPTLEVVPSNAKTAAFLAHSAVPIEFTSEDFQEIAEGKYLVKVIYLPDPQFQELAATGIDQIISTRLEPGADPILEAQRRGSILLVIRMGNVDQEAPNTPPLDCNSPTPAPTGVVPPTMPSAMSPSPTMSIPGLPSNAVLVPSPSPSPSASLPTQVRPGGPSLQPQPPATLPAVPGNSTPLVVPSPGVLVAKSPIPPAVSPTGATQSIPDLLLPPPGMPDRLPELPPCASSVVPPAPGLPPTTAELATQGAKK